MTARAVDATRLVLLGVDECGRLVLLLELQPLRELGRQLVYDSRARFSLQPMDVVERRGW